MARKMKATKVYRGGKTKTKTKFETSEVGLGFKDSYGSSGGPYRERKVLTLDFSISSKGGGTTDVHVAMGKEDFGLLLDAMVRVDRSETMAAMSAELAKQLSTGK